MVPVKKQAGDQSAVFNLAKNSGDPKTGMVFQVLSVTMVDVTL